MTAATGSKRALRDGAGYAAAAALQRALLFLLLPAFTHALSPEQYGALSVALSITGLAVVLFGLAFDFAAFRVYFELDDQPAEQKIAYQTAWRFHLVAAPLAGAAIGMLLWPAVDSYVAVVSPAEVLLSLVSAGFFVAATVVPLAVLRAQQRLRAFLAVNAVAAVSTAGLTAWFVIGLDAGVGGWLAATCVANTLTLITACFAVPLAPGTSFSTAALRHAIALSAPVIPHYAAIWALNLADRLVLARVTTESNLGIYSLAANLVVPLAVVVQALNQGFMESYARAAKEPLALAGLPDKATIQASIVMAATLCVASLGPVFVAFAVADSFMPATTVLPWLALGTGLLGLYYIPINALTLTMGKTQRHWRITVGASALNLVLIPLLIPHLGIAGAGVATAVGYAALLAGISLYGYRLGSPLKLDGRRLSLCLAICIVAYAVQAVAIDYESVEGAIGRSGICIAAASLVLVTASGRRPADFWRKAT